MKLGKDFEFKNSDGFIYEITYAENEGTFEGGILKRGISNISSEPLYFFRRHEERLELFSILGYNRSLRDIPLNLTKQILSHYN